MTATDLTTCERHHTKTALRCGRCETPICARCCVRTDVGQRCPTCAGGRQRRIRGLHAGQRWPVMLAATVAVIVIAGLIFVWAHRNSGTTVVIPPGQQVLAYRSIDNASADYSLVIPSGWLPAADNTSTTLSYADTPPAEGSVHVSVGFDPAPLSQHVANLVTALRAQGGQDFSQMPEMISGLAAIRLDYRFPLSPNSGSRLTNHTSYLVKRDSTSVVSFQLATVDPSGEKIVFQHMEASFQIPR